MVFVGSIVLSINIEGPRNLDTGFKRLDMMFRDQIAALGIAIVAGAMAIFLQGTSRRLKVIGLAPLGITILGVVGVILFTLIINDRAPPQGNTLPPKPVTAAPTQAVPALE